MSTRKPRRARPLAAALLCGLLAVALTALPARAASVGYWKLYVSIDYQSEGTAVDSRCFTNASHDALTTLKATATEKLSIRTLSPGLVEMRRAANGKPLVRERRGAAPMRLSATVERSSGLDGIEPAGCDGRPPSAKQDCGSQTLRTGISLSPYGDGNHWVGFWASPQQLPVFANCPLTGAQSQLPPPVPLDLIAVASQLTSKTTPLLPFRDRDLTTNAPLSIDGNVTSFGHGTLGYSVRLVRATP